MVGVTAALIGSAVIGAGASIISGNKASKAQQQGVDKGIAEERRQFDLTRADYAPWRAGGTAALDQLMRMYGLTPSDRPYGGFTESPGYQFRHDQTVQGVERSLSARGQRFSPASSKALARYIDGLASSEYEAAAQRLSQLAGLGFNATSGTVQAGQQSSGNIANLHVLGGNARASAYANVGSSINNGINNIMGAYMFSQGWGRR